ncbi:MAG: polysaccharide biosynthesis C-terminal domain-containing protein, partial [Clostridia bacterium]|nr:polysaccharide biosynthesis C-terminal domain-containing protein [Clostridia bacterium]
MQQKSNDFLGTERISKLLLRLAVPTVVAQLINMLYNIVDRIYIGHIRDIGSLALTGVGVCMPLIMIVSAFACLVSSGGAPRSSIFLGKGDTESAQKALNNCFSALLILSVVLTEVLFFLNEPLLLLFGASENTIGYAVDYMNIYALGTIFVQMTLGMNSFITAQGYTSVSMVSVVIGAVSNIILDPIFIFACNMGVKGAALATILSQALSCIWVLRFLTGDRSVLRLQKQYMRLEAKVILPCMAL